MTDEPVDEPVEVQAVAEDVGQVRQRASPDVLFLRVQRWVLEGVEPSPSDKEQLAELLRDSQAKAEVALEVMGPHMVRAARRTMGFLGMIEERLFRPGRLDTMEDDTLVRLMQVTQQRQQYALEYVQKRSERAAAMWLREMERKTRQTSLGGTKIEEESPAKRERMRQVIAKLSLLLDGAKQLEGERTPPNGE